MISIKVSLPGNDALTDINPDHFALYADEDWVLIKEKSRGSVQVAASNSVTITHNLGYIPFYAVFGIKADGFGRWINGYNIYSSFQTYATTTTLVLKNNDANTATFQYYIFYDQQV